MIRSLIGRIAPLLGFSGSKQYWETRYRIGGHSGSGSRGKSAEYKAAILNRFISANAISTAVEFGCGDGYQLGMLEIPSYIGIDVSTTVIDRCREMYAGDSSKRFLLLDDYRGETAELSMSLDVIYHLVEDRIYDEYLQKLFAAGTRFVVIYATSFDLAATGTPHVRHRDVTSDIETRFPQYSRMRDEESLLPLPVATDRGLPIQFFIYSVT
jgi:hypothetical protein